MVQMMVTVPDGVMSGQQMQVNGPDGQAMIVTVPEGVDAGGQFGVMVRSRRMPPTRLCSHMHCAHRHSAGETRMSSVRPGLWHSWHVAFVRTRAPPLLHCTGSRALWK